MKCVEVDGKDKSRDIKLIKSKLEENSGVIFIYTGTGAIYDYIHALHNDGKGLDENVRLNDAELYKFRICYANQPTNEKLNITVIPQDGNGKDLSSMKQLLEMLDGEKACRIVVNSNKKEELAFIVQQLIYIQYPMKLEKFEILLRQEEIDADKIKRFKERVDDLTETCTESVERLEKLVEQTKLESMDAPAREERLEDTKSALECCKSIRKNLEKARMVELKLAVAATKKTGKSVVVNSFIGEELAPTDVQLATPNNCIYRKSRDNKYRLWMEGDNGKAKEYDSSKEIWKDIEDLFRSAQNDTENDFVLSDMHIEYCAPGNNYSSYTIYDTPGPDAAGTNHREPARRAINKCDVVVFCIDYSKYLTDSEESYLKEVKNIFKAQQKFHSLIFALNKIDVRYDDSKQSKSIVQAVDFVKTRLARIGDEYRDCIIFPTSSLEYFNAIEAENYGVSELNVPKSELEMIKLAKNHRDVPALKWLQGHASDLCYYHNIEEFTYDVFKQDSGMPALMSYVSYVATSKAREEIINHVACDIDQQNIKLNTILSTVSNLEALIKADKNQINEIKNILENYTRDIVTVLTTDFTVNDLKILPSDSVFKKKYQGDLNQAIEQTNKKIDAFFDENEIINKVYGSIVRKMYGKLVSYKGEIVEGEDKLQAVTNSLFNSADVNEALHNYCIEQNALISEAFLNEIKSVKKDIEKIGNDRQRRAKMVSEQAKNALKKQNVNLQLPEFPNVQFSAEIHNPDMTEISVNVNNSKLKLGDLFNTGYSFGGILFSIITLGIYDPKLRGKLKQIEYDDFKTICDDKLRDGFEKELYKAKVCDKMHKQAEGILITNYVDIMIKDLKYAFDDMLKVQKDCVECFLNIIDDTDKYKQEIEQRTARKDTIYQVQNCTKDFMNVWNSVVSAVASS